MLDLLLSERNIQEAMLHLLSGKDRTDPSGVSLHDLPEYWHINRDLVCDAIRGRFYMAETIHMRKQPKKGGETRWIAAIPHIDALLLRMLHQTLTPCCQPYLSPACFAYVQGRSTADAVARVQEGLKDGRTWCARLDIADFFDSILLPKVMALLRAIVPDEGVLSLVDALLHPDRDVPPRDPERGLLQGSPLSPLLSNLYLAPFDSLWDKDAGYLRYADDILFLSESRQAAEAWLSAATEALAEVGLAPNADKTRVAETTSQTILGYTLRPFYNGWKAVPVRRAAQEIATDWRETRIEPAEKSLYLNAEGRLSAKDGALLFTGETISQYIPADSIDAIHLLDQVHFSSLFFAYAHRKRMRVCFYDANGQYVGDFLPASVNAYPALLLRQAEACGTEPSRLRFAAPLLQASLQHMIYVLNHYARKGNGLTAVAGKLKAVQARMAESRTVPALMLLEAQARQEYYGAFPAMANDPAFRFRKRTRRPPEDAINALISFGNVFLYQRVATEVHRAGLDIRLSFLHAPNQRRDSLSYDIAELFKPLVVDRAIFSLINRKQIHPKRHFEQRDGGVFLTREGRAIFLKELNGRMNTHVTVSGRNVSWRVVITDEAYKIRNALEQGGEYQPFRYR